MDDSAYGYGCPENWALSYTSDASAMRALKSLGKIDSPAKWGHVTGSVQKDDHLQYRVPVQAPPLLCQQYLALAVTRSWDLN